MRPRLTLEVLGLARRVFLPSTHRLLIAPTGFAHRRAPTKITARLTAVALASITRRAHRHFPLTEPAKEEPEILPNPRVELQRTGQASPFRQHCPPAAPRRGWEGPGETSKSFSPWAFGLYQAACLSDGGRMIQPHSVPGQSTEEIRAEFRRSSEVGHIWRAEAGVIAGEHIRVISREC